MAKPKPGETYKYAGEEPLGEPGSPAGVAPGTVVTVREIVPADTPGAHDDSEDCVVVEIAVPYVANDDDGNPVIQYSSRAYSVGLDAFASDYTKEG